MLILLVEDRPGQRELIEECLAVEGHQVVGVGGGKAAIQTLQTAEFDLVITDWAMPDLNGMEVAAQIKEMMPDLPVILITGYAEPVEDEPKGTRNVDLVLSKPVGLRDLRRAIARVQEKSAE